MTCHLTVDLRYETGFCLETSRIYVQKITLINQSTKFFFLIIIKHRDKHQQQLCSGLATGFSCSIARKFGNPKRFFSIAIHSAFIECLLWVEIEAVSQCKQKPHIKYQHWPSALYIRGGKGRELRTSSLVLKQRFIILALNA